jgi:hypothetical protein
MKNLESRWNLKILDIIEILKLADFEITNLNSPLVFRNATTEIIKNAAIKY